MILKVIDAESPVIIFCVWQTVQMIWTDSIEVF